MFKFAVVATLSITIIFFLANTHGCKLYCLVCPNDRLTRREYYCCMEDWQRSPIVRSCESSTTTSSTISTTASITTVSPTPATPPTTPCPTLQPPNRCPKSEKRSDEECENYKRFYPNPKHCTIDNDCTTPFNVCCEDQCFKMTKICKTYKTEFEP